MGLFGQVSTMVLKNFANGFKHECFPKQSAEIPGFGDVKEGDGVDFLEIFSGPILCRVFYKHMRR